MSGSEKPSHHTRGFRQSRSASDRTDQTEAPRRARSASEGVPLLILHIPDRRVQRSPRLQVSGTAVLGPDPTPAIHACCPQFPGCVGLELREHPLGRGVTCPDHNVNMVAQAAKCEKMPLSDPAVPDNGGPDDPSLIWTQTDRFGSHPLLHCTLAGWVGRTVIHHVAGIEPVNRPPFVSMEPRPITRPRQQVTEHFSHRCSSFRCRFPRWRFGLAESLSPVGSLAGASGSPKVCLRSVPSLALRARR
jgi:hypothetical protein